MSSLIQEETKDFVACLQLNRPEKANAYTTELIHALEAALQRLESDDSIDVVILTGAGARSFCAGADLTELRQKDHRTPLKLPSAKLFHYLADFPKVTLAAINGHAIAGGLELALACDLRICSDNATFALPETNLGLIPAAGGTQRLTAVVGIAKAKEIILGGKKWTAHQALQHGLVSEVTAVSALMPRVWAWAKEIANRNSLALQLAKKAINLTQESNGGHSFEKAAQALLYELSNAKHALS
ncbi:MAG: enoyl-CoA hydratase/isomerase family protein [Flammeovirgaceae bacterium]